MIDVSDLLDTVSKLIIRINHPAKKPHKLCIRDDVLILVPGSSTKASDIEVYELTTSDLELGPTSRTWSKIRARLQSNRSKGRLPA